MKPVSYEYVTFDDVRCVYSLQNVLQVAFLPGLTQLVIITTYAIGGYSWDRIQDQQHTSLVLS
jgi:hypothetical protein